MTKHILKGDCYHDIRCDSWWYLYYLIIKFKLLGGQGNVERAADTSPNNWDKIIPWPSYWTPKDEEKPWKKDALSGKPLNFFKRPQLSLKMRMRRIPSNCLEGNLLPK